ncbi:MAG: ABC transporter ATP-binding protein [Actinomycetota bacterium]|nr:ABC transporter ATP-binding protein [Actinomycetota bacterium]
MTELDLTKERTGTGLRLLRQAIGEHRRGIALGMAVSILWTLAKISVPLLIRQGIDDGIRGDGSLLLWSLLVVAVGGVSAICTGLRRYVAFRNARAVEAEFRDRVYQHIQRLHFAFHDRMQTGQLMSRGNTDLQQFQNFITMLPVTAANLMTVVVAAVILFWLNWSLATLALMGLPLANYFGRRFAKKLHPAVMGIQEESAQLATVVEETIAGVRVVKGFGAEQMRADALAKEADDVYLRSLEAASARAAHLPALELVPNIGLIAVLGYGGHQVLNGTLEVGELVLFNIYVVLLIQPLRMLGMMVANYQRASAAGERLASVLDTEVEIVDPDQPTPLPDVMEAGAVTFRDVDFEYEPGEPVLRGFDLEIAAGESVAIVGATGSGKSTVARLLPRFYDIGSGSIELDGVLVNEVALDELRTAIGIVFEDTFLFSSSVRDNIAFGVPDASDEVIRRAALLEGAAEFIAELPDSYDTELGERGFSLSGGQRQRIAIARAIASDPRVLVLDDATSAVDPTKEHEIRDALGEVMRDRTTIVIAHRAATIALADRVVLLDEGRVAAMGTHDELLASNERYREVLAQGAAKHAKAHDEVVD